MPIIDLSPAPPPAPTTTLDAAPRRVGLTLPELEYVAAATGGAPLPFEVSAPAEGGALEDRLGRSRATTADQAYRSALASLPEPGASLGRRGLLVDGHLAPGLAGAVGLLATPDVAVDIDVACGAVRAKAWHRQAGTAVAALATVDGIVFELAWLAADAWPGELARVTVVSEEVELRESAVPAFVDLPFELADAATEAIDAGRTDLVAVLAARHSGAVRDGDGVALADADVVRILTALGTEARGRVRALVADVRGGAEPTATSIGVVSWTLLADGWHALRPRRESGEHRVTISRVQPEDLAAAVAPALAEAAR